MNLKYAYQKLELEIAANFGAGDLFVTLTYDDAHLPSNRKDAVKRIQGFWRKLRKVRGKADLRYLYVTEGKHGGERLHHHVLINALGDDFQTIRDLWSFGQVDLVPLSFGVEQTFEALARYLCKEQRGKVGQRLWSGSRNLKKPEVETFRVEDDTSLVPPPGALVLEDSGDHVTTYGHFRFLKFIAKGGLDAPKKRRRRRPKE